MRLGAFSLLSLSVLSVVAGCSGSEAPDGACPGSDPDCNDASSVTQDSSTGGQVDTGAGADTSAPITDGGADADADALCVLIVDDAGVSHGCSAGGQGPGDHDDGGVDAAPPPPPDAALDASDLPLGASCWDNAQCASDICFDYVVRGTFCTQRCWTNANCPPPANGCNGQGVCRFGDGG